MALVFELGSSAVHMPAHSCRGFSASVEEQVACDVVTTTMDANWTRKHDVYFHHLAQHRHLVRKLAPASAKTQVRLVRSGG